MASPQSFAIHWPILWTLLLVLASGCTSSRGSVFATDPPGARVIINGQDSGFVTPCNIALSGDTHEIDFALPGYATANRTMRPVKQRYSVLYREWISHYNTWKFLFWLSIEDVFVPIKTISKKSPQRLFVRLRRQADV
jgi:hypothetical protein